MKIFRHEIHYSGSVNLRLHGAQAEKISKPKGLFIYCYAWRKLKNVIIGDHVTRGGISIYGLGKTAGSSSMIR